MTDRAFTDEDRRELGALLERVNAARQFPVNTDGASRHVQIAAEVLAANQPYPMFDEDRASIAASMLATVAALYEARTELKHRRSQDAGGWRLIETCPKEHGASILLCRWEAPPAVSAIGEGYWWQEDASTGYWAFNEFTPSEDMDKPSRFDAPTHWQPLPASPTMEPTNAQ